MSEARELLERLVLKPGTRRVLELAVRDASKIDGLAKISPTLYRHVKEKIHPDLLECIQVGGQHFVRATDEAKIFLKYREET